jgi:hypothetical protein
MRSIGGSFNTLNARQTERQSIPLRFKASEFSDEEYMMRDSTHGPLVFTLGEMGMSSNKAIRELLLQGAEAIYTLEMGIPINQFGMGMKQRASLFPRSPLDNFEAAFDQAVQNGFTQDELCQVLRISVAHMAQNDPDAGIKAKAAQVYRLMTAKA